MKMTEEACAEFVLSSPDWNTIEPVINELIKKGFNSYEVGRSRILVRDSFQKYQEAMNISLRKEGKYYVPVGEVQVPEEFKPYVTSIEFPTPPKFFP